MKKAGIFLGGLLLLAAAFWWRAAPPPPPAPPSPPPMAEEPDPLHPPPPPAREPRPEDKLPPGTGGIRFFVHFRGAPIPDAEIAVLKAHTDKPMILRTKADGTQALVGMPPVEFGVTARLLPRYLPSSTHFKVEADRIHEVRLELKRGCRVHGRVVDASGTGLKEAVISLVFAGRIGMSHLRAVTDDEGRYAIEPVDPGVYTAIVRHDRFKPQRDLPVAVPVPGDEFELNAVLRTGARLAGRVVDETGKGVPGAIVNLSSVKSGGTRKTDAEGGWEFHGLEATLTNISAEKEGYGVVYLRNTPVDREDVVLVLSTPGRIHVRLLADPHPVNFAVVLTRWEESVKQVLPVYSRFYTTETPATVLLSDVPPGEYTVEVQAGGWEAQVRPKVTVASGQTLEAVEIPLRSVK
jgi:hypothetical protein